MRETLTPMAMVRAGVTLCLLHLLVWRARAASNLTQEEKDLFVQAHNELRAIVQPEAANMMFMKWDESLATMAQEWSERCYWDHGQPEPNITPFEDLGQNLYLITGYGNRPSGLAVSKAWYNETRFYTYETNGCQSNKMCGHYTQLAWATTYAIGCGMAFCETANETKHTNLWLVTCDYGPNGNVKGQKPYVTGKSCTKCDSGVGECYNGLCRRCSDHSEECVCAQTCANCGELNSTACSCKCPNGFDGTDCSDICEDKSSKCGVFSGGWPVFWCNDGEDMQDFMFEKCPATCGLCVEEQDPDFECNEPQTTSQPTVETHTTRCVQFECQNGGTFIEESCRCTCTSLYEGIQCEQPQTTSRPTVETHTTRCVQFECQNGGTFIEESCRCTCTSQYEGPQCEQLRPTWEPDTTTLEPQPTACLPLECQNEGTFDEEACRCRCTAEYQGKLCQHNREEANNGVVIILIADINSWGTMEPALINAIAESLTSHCNDNFEACCPNRGPKTIPERLAYANESNILVAEGYPMPKKDTAGAFSTMFLAKGLEEAELCIEGGTALARRRRGVAPGFLPHDVHSRAASSGLYLDQDILLAVIQNSTDKLKESLADVGITATISSVEAGREEPPDVITAMPPPKTALPPSTPAPFPGLSTIAIVAIVVGAVMLMIVCVVLIVALFITLSKAHSNDVKPLKEDPIDMKSYNGNNCATDNDYHDTYTHHQ